MSYIVRVEASYNEGDTSQESIKPAIVYQAFLEEERDARDALGKYLNDSQTLLKMSNRFRPEFLTATIHHRGEYADAWNIIHHDTIII